MKDRDLILWLLISKCGRRKMRGNSRQEGEEWEEEEEWEEDEVLLLLVVGGGDCDVCRGG